MSVFNDSFLFIHIPKTAGTSIKWWLLGNLPGARGPRPDAPDSARLHGYPIGHLALRDIVDPPPAWQRNLGTVPRPAESFQKIIAVFRNPYEQLVSQYMFWLGRAWEGARARGVEPNAVDYHDPAMRPLFHIHDFLAARAWSDAAYDIQAGFRLWLTRPRSSDFLQWYEEKVTPVRIATLAAENGYAGFSGYCHYWVALDGAVPGNVEILRMEELHTEWPRAMAPFVKNPPPLGCVNKHGAKVVRFWFYTPETARLVEDRFRWSFDNFYDRMTW